MKEINNYIYLCIYLFSFVAFLVCYYIFRYGDEQFRVSFLCVCVCVCVFPYYFTLLGGFFTPVLADSFSQEAELQQVSSSLQDSS